MEKKYLDVPFNIKAEDIDDAGTFKGYGSTFGGDPDAHGDIVVEGAFKSSIKKGGRNKNGVAMLWQHNSSEVPGVWTSLKEDNLGLLVEGRLLMDTILGRESHSRLKAGAVKGLSIGYDTLDEEIDKENDVRYLKKLDLWEISLVTFPANIHAGILDVKQADAVKAAETPREFENALRELGLSKSLSKYITKLCRGSLREVKDEGVSESDHMKNLLATIQQVNLSLEVNREIQNAIF